MIPNAPAQQAGALVPQMPAQLYAFVKQNFPQWNNMQIQQGWQQVASQMQAKGLDPTTPANQQIIAKLLVHPQSTMGKPQTPIQAPAPQAFEDGGIVVTPNVTPNVDPMEAALIKDPVERLAVLKAMNLTKTPAATEAPQADPQSAPAQAAPNVSADPAQAQASLNQFNPDAVNAANAAYAQQAQAIRDQRGVGALFAYGPENAKNWQDQTNAQILQAKDQTVGNQQNLQTQATAGLAGQTANQSLQMAAAKFGPELSTAQSLAASNGVNLENLQGAQKLLQQGRDPSSDTSVTTRAAVQKQLAIMGVNITIPASMSGEAAIHLLQDQVQATNAGTARIPAAQAAGLAAGATNTTAPAGATSTGSPGAGILYTPPGFTNPNATAATANATDASSRVNNLRAGTTAFQSTGLGATIKDIQKTIGPSGLANTGSIYRLLQSAGGSVTAGDLQRKLATAYEARIRSDAAMSGGIVGSKVVQDAEQKANDLLNQNPQVALSTMADMERNNQIQTQLVGSMEKHIAGPGNGTLTGWYPGVTSAKQWNPQTRKVE